MPHATYGVAPPQAGTQTATNMLISVANPIGAVPRKSDCTGCWSIRFQVAGYSVYLRIEKSRMAAKSRVFRVKKTMLSHFSELCALG